MVYNCHHFRMLVFLSGGGMEKTVYRNLTIAALIMMASVFLSRVIGLVREMVIAGVGGTRATVDAYQVAFVIPEILNHIVAMEIGKEFSVPRDSVATVVTPLMGQAAINIIPPATPTEPLPQDGSAEPIDGILKNPLSGSR